MGVASSLQVLHFLIILDIHIVGKLKYYSFTILGKLKARLINYLKDYYTENFIQIVLHKNSMSILSQSCSRILAD